MKKIILPFILFTTLMSCDSSKKITQKENSVKENNKEKTETIDLDYLNTSVRPQDDFFEFANGTWVKNNPVPPSESRWGSFNELQQANIKKLTTLLNEAVALNAEKGTTEQILADYYSSFMDMKTRNLLSIDAIKSDIELVENLNSKIQLPFIIAIHHKQGINSLFSFGVDQDLKNVDQHIVYFSQGGISLPNKEYYSAPEKEDILAEYKNHILKIMRLTGFSTQESERISANAIQFETDLAEFMMAPAELRIPEKTYNKYSMSILKGDKYEFNFESYLGEIGIEDFDTLILAQPSYYKNMSKMVANKSLTEWKDYLLWKVIDNYAGHLDEKMVKTNFEFYGGILSGKTEQKPLNEQAINEITGQVFAELLGKKFVSRYFSDVANQKVNEMVDNLLVVFKERIEQLDWMTSDTKKQALHKLQSIKRKLGFPQVWEDFSSLNFSKDDYIQNLKEAARFEHTKNIEKLNEPVNKDEWHMPAHMVNAYYHPLLNEIVFPAGIMQAPFFDENYEDAVNYGRIGMVIGHEFTHGFDDMGSKFAADGSFTDWWSADDKKAFEERTGKLGETFDHFCPIDDACVNSQLTMGENIADLGGLTMAYYAYSMTDEFKNNEKRKGFTPAQRFFIAYAQLWKINYTEEELKNRIANDPHSPGMYRVNGPLMNCPEFFQAFMVEVGDPMRNDEDKIARIW